MKRRKTSILIFSTAIAALAFGYYKLTQAQKEFVESKYVHETTGTVIGKEDFQRVLLELS